MSTVTENSFNPFAGMKNAKVYEQGTFLNPGMYTLQIERCIFKKTFKSGEAFLVEFIVQESNNEKHKPGEKVTWFQGMKMPEVAFGALKLFAYAVCGRKYPDDKAICEKEIDPVIEDLMAEAVQKNSMAGKKVKVQVSMKPTKEKKDFSLHVWSPA